MSVTLTQRQKNIVNPYADQTFQDRLGGQQGVAAYEYNEIRNKFVLDAIHDSFINFQNFPTIGQVLNPDISVPEGQNIITTRDARAYFSLYPQNGRVANDPVSGELSMVSWGGDEANEQLDILVARLSQNQVLENYTTLTTELSTEDDNISDLEKNRNNLLAIKPNHSFPYLTRLRRSLGLSTEDILNISEDPLENTLLSGEITTFIGGDANVDLYDWVSNTQPGTDKEKVYFNAVDDRFYYVVRTDLANFPELDIAWVIPELVDLNVVENYQSIAGRGIEKILKFSGRFSAENKEAVEVGRGGIEAPEYLQYNLEEDDPPRLRRYNIYTSKDPRPGSRWVAAVTISKEVIDNLPVEQAISFEDEQLSPYQKSKVMTDREKTSLLKKEPRFYQNLSLARKLEDVYDLLVEYAEKLREESIGPILTNNVDIEEEAFRVDSFYDTFTTFYSFNKASIQDDDLVQFYFDDSYQLLYICINGVAYTRGTGNINFQPPIEGDEPAVVLDAFSFLTSTTFSYIYNAFEISEEFLVSTPDSRRPWTAFLQQFTFPPLDVSPKKIDQLKRNQSTYNLRNTLAQQKNLFTSLTKVLKMPTDQRERLFNERERFLFLSDAVFAAGCDSGAATALKETLVALAVLEGKISVRTYLRRMIRSIKFEVIQDETTKRLLLAGATGDSENISREVQRMVEARIFCSLDVLGGAVGSAVLQATDSTPAAHELSHVVKNKEFTLEFKKLPLMNKQNKAKKSLPNSC